MTINTTTLEANLTTKINATSGTTDGKEFLLLGKAVEALTIPASVAAMTAAGTTQVGLVNSEGATQVAAVQAAGSSYLPITTAASTYAPLASPTLTGTANAADLILSGNLTVNGTTTTVNSTTLDVTDKNITIAKSAADAAAANGAGITVDGASANITYTSATDTWDFNKAVTGTYTNLSPVVVTATVNSATNIDMTKPSTATTMSGAMTFTPTSMAAGRGSMMLLDTSSTPHTPTFAAAFKWPAATEPTWAESRYWVVSMVCLNGTNVLASASGYTV